MAQRGATCNSLLWTLVSQLQGTSDFLTNQMDAIDVKPLGKICKMYIDPKAACYKPEQLHRFMILRLIN